jgi:alkylation response protein AidB-like acyl-CoA dehydrogenase
VPTAEQVRETFGAWLDQNWDPELSVREWWSRLAGAGWSMSGLPEPHGKGFSREETAAVIATMRERGVMGGPAGVGISLTLPTVLTHGTDAQIARFVPRILDGSEGWCQLFSEPGAGSDLAGLQTRAVRDGDEWVVNGQKVWTSTGQHADWGILIARTNPELPKHQGITYFLLPMHQPGVDVRPLREMTGHAVFNEVFFDDARVSDAYRLGDIGAGWAVANTTLMHERMGIGTAEGGFGRAAPGTVAGHLDRQVKEFIRRDARPQISQGSVSAGTVQRFIGMARERDKLGEPTVRQAIADLYSRVQIMRWSAQRARADAKGRTGVEGPMAKVAMTDVVQRGRELGCAIFGPDAQLWGPDTPTAGWFQEFIVFSPAPGIYGGTDQVQRNIISERGLGLPKEPGHPRDTPFKDLPANATR